MLRRESRRNGKSGTPRAEKRKIGVGKENAPVIIHDDNEATDDEHLVRKKRKVASTSADEGNTQAETGIPNLSDNVNANSHEQSSTKAFESKPQTPPTKTPSPEKTKTPSPNKTQNSSNPENQRGSPLKILEQHLRGALPELDSEHSQKSIGK
jgi:hypothetical protein